MNMPLRFPAGIYAITPNWPNTNKLLEAIEKASKTHKISALQWRRKSEHNEDLTQQAEQVVKLCKQLGITSIINDNWRLALQLDADGAHLGRDDASASELTLARATLGPDKILGVSCYNELDRACNMLELDADYLAFGTVYSSPTKPDAVRAPLNMLGQARQLCIKAAEIQGHNKRTAVVAIGGVTLDKLTELQEHGADSFAMISGLFTIK